MKSLLREKNWLWLGLPALAASLLLVWQNQPRTVEADSAPQVELSAAGTGPRAMEKLTEASIRRDYGYAWQNLAEAFEANRPDLLNADFVGPARTTLENAIAGQQKAGLHSRFQKQSHKLEAVFYAPEGDVVELHDTATYEWQLTAEDKTLHEEHAVVRYVVLMTPGADRWFVRQLQAVPSF